MRKYFLGSNTPKGFYSYYDSLISQSDAKKIYVIKGGPGTGKSTLMKRIAYFAEENGFGADYIYCSSDPGSLDGLVIPEMKVAFVDGTSPHIVDPKTPGAVDVIVNLGNFWNEKNMKKNKGDIINTGLEISDKFDLAYDHLKAAGVLHKTIRKLQKKCYNEEEIEKKADEIIFNEITDISDSGKGFKRKLFASSYGPEGYISYAHTLHYGKKYVVRGAGTPVIMNKLAECFLKYKFDIETFFNPIAPDEEILHIYVPELDLGIFTYGEGVCEEGGTLIDLTTLSSAAIAEKYKDEMSQCVSSFESQVLYACSIIKKAKALHDKLEGYYIPNMDFAELEKTTAKILDQLEDLR